MRQIITLTLCLLSSLLWAQADLFSELRFRSVGPTRGGRATCITGVAAQPGTFYMGATGGGVWKTTNFGNSWQNVSDGYFPTPSIGAIRVAATEPNTVYVGTGSDGMRSNVIMGKGMFKSTDGGKKWSAIGLKKAGQIGAVEIHPEDANTVLVAAIGNPFAPNEERGIFRTTDGGSNWEKVLYISAQTGFADLEFHPTRPELIYAAAWEAERKPWTIKSGGTEGGIWRSEDGGDTWKKLAGGLPNGIIGKIDLAVSADDPDRLYALVEARPPEGGLYRSDDQGESWKLVSDESGLLDRPFYYCNVDADPQNADRVIVNSTRFYVSENGGADWKRQSTPHGDNHEIWIHPTDSMQWAQVNDGGANISLDAGKSWTGQNNQPTSELYQVEVDDRYPYWLYAGQQDNWTTIAVPSNIPGFKMANGVDYLEATGGCETGPAVPKPGNPDIVYANCKGRFGVYDRRTGQEKQYYVGASNMYGHNPNELKFRFQRVSPIHVSPHNPDVVYHCSQYVHKTTDDGKTWEIISPDLTAFEADKQVISGSPITRDITGEEFYSTIYSIRESALEEGLIWVGANDGPVHVTRNGGKDWSNVTPNALPSGGRIDCVEPSAHRAGKAYFSSLRYQLGDEKPYIYKTTDYGKSWTLITKGLPTDHPVRVVREDPEREGLLYAGTEYGLFISFDDGENWTTFQQNIPVTPVTDIKVHRGDLVLSTMGRGFWILDDVSALRQITTKPEAVTVLPPATTVRMRSAWGRGSGQLRYPGTQQFIHYFLPEKTETAITLDILDNEGTLIRSFTSEKPEKEASRAMPDMATGAVEQGFSRQLKKTEGLHRFAWDMRHTGPWHENASRSGSGGPMVTPGRYTVRLTVGEDVLTQQFNLLPDPRLEETGVSASDLKAQEELSLQVRDLMSQANQLDWQVAQKLKAEDLTDEERQKLEQLAAHLTIAEGRYRKPMLTNQISYLYSMLSRADQAPGKDAKERFEELKKELSAIML